MLLARLVEEFKAANPHWQPTTRRRVDNHLELLCILLGKDRQIETITKHDFRHVRMMLPRVSSNATKRKVGLVGCPPFLSVKSRNDFITWVRSFWKWLELSFDEVTYNPTIALQAFKGEVSSRDVISDESLASWLEESTPRDRLLIASLSLTGTRLGELAMALPSDVDVSSGTLSIRPNKARHLKTPCSHRMIPLHPSIDAQELKDCLPFTSTKAGLAILSKRLNRRLNKVIDNASVCVHSLRHWIATKLKEQGVEDSLVADILGHSLGTMTSRYAKSSSIDRKRVAIARLALPVR